jgi:uncharacterized protein (DUF427 family)
LTVPNIPPIESVWDYPRPPRLEPTSSHIRIVHHGVVLADTTRALRILETSHPPVYYLPPADLTMQYLKRSLTRSSFCEFKGNATYWTIEISPDRSSPSAPPAADLESGTLTPPSLTTIRIADAAWSYAQPSPPYAALRDHLAFYANRVEKCIVDGEHVQPQPGDFYGGWITSRITGPFKGPPGTRGW